MKRRSLALWLMITCVGVALPESALAVATTKVNLTSTVWTDLGVGPLQLNSGGTQIVYAISDTTPSVLQLGFAVPTNSNQVVNTASHVWAMSATPLAASVIVAQVAGTSGSGGTFTWPGSATVTTYGVAPTGTVPGVNAFVTNGAGGGGTGWLSSLAYTTGNITSASSTIAFPAGFTTGSTIRVYNRGPNPIHWTYGPATPTATVNMARLEPYSNDSFVIHANDTLFAAITPAAGQTSNVNLELGAGNPSGTSGPLNLAVASTGTATTSVEVTGGLDNAGLARQIQATAPGTAATNFLLGVQGNPGATPIPTSGAATIADGADVATGATSATAWSGSGNSTVIAALKAMYGKLNATVDATLNAQKVIPATNVPPGSCSVTTASANVAINLPNLGTANVHGFHIVNKDGTTGGGEAVGVNFVSTAAFTGSVDTVLLAPPATAKDTGGSFTTSPGEGLNHAVSVIAPSAGHVVWCMWY